MIVAFMTAGRSSRAEASTVVTPPINQLGVAVDYVEETVTLTPGSNNSTKFYISKDGQKTWEMIEPAGSVDISTLLSTRDVYLYFKGNKDTTIAELKLPAQDASLKATYSVIDGVGRIMLSGTSFPIEFRKGTNGYWKTLPTASTTLITTPYETYGATLYFRIAPATTRRSGKIITVKVSKKPSAPSVKLDGSKLYISGLKPGETQYRAGDSTIWLDFTPTDTKLKTIDLKDLLAPTATVNTPIPAGTIEVRTKATTGKVASSIKVIDVALQPTVPNVITITGSTLTVQDINTKRQYEYTRVSGTAALNIKTAKWTSFTSSKPVIIKGAAVGDKIYVRVKSYTDSTTKQLILASTYKELTVSSITTVTR
jgi:hypothetical protein